MSGLAGEEKGFKAWAESRGVPAGLRTKARTKDGYGTLTKADTKGLRAKFEQFARLEDAPAPSKSSSGCSSPSSSAPPASSPLADAFACANGGAQSDEQRLEALVRLLNDQPSRKASLVEVDQALNVIVFHLQSVLTLPQSSDDDVSILIHDDDAWKIKSVEGGMGVYEFLGLEEEPDQPTTLMVLRDRERLTAELLDMTLAKLQELQQAISEKLGSLPYQELHLGGSREAPSSSPSLRFPVAVAEMKGRRRTMEDYVMVWGNFRGRQEEDYFSLFDGHGGSDASLFACENLHFQIWKHMNLKRIEEGVDPAKHSEKVKQTIRDAYFATHDLMRRNKELNGKKIKGGTTVVTALIIESLLYIAHVGDSRAVLYAIEETEEVWRRRTATTNDGVQRDAFIGRRKTAPAAVESNSTSSQDIKCDEDDHDEESDEGEETPEGGAIQPRKRKVLRARTLSVTTDHKPNDEKEKKRIEEAGGLVIFSKMDGVPRLNGKIAVSRSLGDLHDPNVDGYMSQEPDFQEVNLAELGKSTSDKAVKSLILVLACDGLWDKLSNQDVGEIIKQQLSVDADLYCIAETLMKTSYDKGSTDNISVVVIDLSYFCSPSS